ncbi:MAG TPA: MFS transporter, partial [Pyrinomonadaceae bacterium]|nr:MFS transporter [Pyrinomonadaceae bacterium]
FLFGPIAGVVVDRMQRRRVMIVADIVRALLALGFLLAGTFAALPVIYTVGATLFTVSAFFNAAKRATIPTLVRDREGLMAANSLSASTTAATIAVGSALGGMVATFIGRNTVFILNALTFLLSAEMIRRIRAARVAEDAATHGRLDDGQERSENVLKSEDENLSFLPTPASTPFGVSFRQRRLSPFNALRRAFGDFLEGLRYVRRVHVLSAIFIVAAGWGLGNGVARALYSIFGAHLGERAASGWVARPTDFGISVLFVAMGAGGVLGAPLARRLNTGSIDNLGARMGRSMIFDGFGLLIFSLMPSLWGAAIILILREINFAIWWTAQQTILMSRTENRYAGRIFASYETLTTLMMVGSMLVSGFAADRYGITPVAAAGGIVISLSGTTWFILRFLKRRRHAFTNHQDVHASR